MARYTGPKHKLCRQFGEKLCDSPKCPVIKRPYRPGQHGPKGKQRLTEYGIQLREKQKASRIYHILERQFRNYVAKAKKSRGNAGANLVQLLETRLDNTLYRFKFAASREAARQAVSHGHVLVNGRKVNIPSYQAKIGDTIAINDTLLASPLYAERIKGLQEKEVPGWLELVDASKLIGRVTAMPIDSDLEQGFDTSLIIEFYSR